MSGYKPVIGFANQKGGVGKTTSAKMFSEFCASLKNKQTLGIDMDPQYSFTARFLGVHKNPITDYKEPVRIGLTRRSFPDDLAAYLAVRRGAG